MKKRLLTFAGILAILAVIGKFYAVPLYAQVKAALVQDRDNMARNFYQQYVRTTNCPATCEAQFPAVPTGKRLIVQQVSAAVVFGQANAHSPAQIELRMVNNGNFFQFLPLFAAPSNYSGETLFSTHSSVLAAYNAGEQPDLVTFAVYSEPYQLIAQISGYTIDIP